MMRCGENNHHVHNRYEEEMAPSLDVTDTDEDVSNNSIVHKPFHKPSLKNIYGRKQIIMQHRQQNLIPEQFIRRTD